jgi:23S rRNA (adenine2503-C2)-methyltransferase
LEEYRAKSGNDIKRALRHMSSPELPVLSGETINDLEKLFSPAPRFRAAQVFKWITSGVSSFDEMANLPLAMRQEFSGRYILRPKTAVSRHSADDGTVKLVLGFADGARIEAVLLSDAGNSDEPDDAKPRRTACISTQAGCPAGCVFCKTGSIGFSRNLSSAEIVEQFLQLKAEAQNTALENQDMPVSNIVIMGMGEPLLNLEQLRKALAVICDSHGFNFSKRRITLSTCGIVDGIISLADAGPAVRLALSLTAADESLRQALMPITASHPLRDVKKALCYFQEKGGGRITLEAVLLGGINTGEKDAFAMAEFAKGLDATVNLIPWNPVKDLNFNGKPLKQPSPAEVADFSQKLKSLGLNVTRRFRRGRGVMGACGQLG